VVVAKRRDFELEAGARAHFEDAAYYDQTYATRTDDVAYYRSVAQGVDSVLEHGVGNGRIALPLAREGSAVTGIDHSAPMLHDLRARLAREKPDVRRRVRVVQGDLRTKRIGKRFPLVICPFNTALHFYTRTDVEAWLARVREHLLPRGELVFDISMPIVRDLSRDPRVPFRVPPFDHPTAGRVGYREHFDYDPVRQILFVSMFFEPRAPSSASRPQTASGRTNGKAPRRDAEFMTPLAHRQFFPQEMEALLHYNGWKVVDLFGDFARGPLVPTSDVMVWHAKAKREARRGKAG
jgi:SAM-dependent methyltransferase